MSDYRIGFSSVCYRGTGQTKHFKKGHDQIITIISPEDLRGKIRAI